MIYLDIGNEILVVYNTSSYWNLFYSNLQKIQGRSFTITIQNGQLQINI